MQKLYEELKDKGFDLIALNSGDSADAINKYVDENKFTFKIVMGGKPGSKGYAVIERYGVEAYPTNYLVDSNGKVIWRGVGSVDLLLHLTFDEGALIEALKGIGLK